MAVKSLSFYLFKFKNKNLKLGSQASSSPLKDSCLFLVGYFSKIVSHYSSLIYSAVPKYPSNAVIEQEMNTVRPAILCLNNSGFHLGRPLAINQRQERRDIPIMKCKFLDTSFDQSAVCCEHGWHVC